MNSNKEFSTIKMSFSQNSIRLKQCLSKLEFEKCNSKYLKKYSNPGTLYSLFNHDLFNMDLLLGYLNSKNEPGIQDCLVNFIYKRFINQSFFYIPELCLLLSYKPNFQSLENYILDRCVDRIKFSLKVYWMILSYSENADTRAKEVFDHLLQKIEMTLVNGRRSTLSNYISHKHTLLLQSNQQIREDSLKNNRDGLQTIEHMEEDPDERIFRSSIAKQEKLSFFDKVIHFYIDLRKMCDKLKSFPKVAPKHSPNADTRTTLLKAYLNYFNTLLSFMQSEETMYKGFILPFDDYTSTSDEFNTVIVNFLHEYSQCFSSKARVPVKITVETVRLIECKDWDKLIDRENFEQKAKEYTEKTNSKIPRSFFFYYNKQMKTESNEKKVIVYKSIDDFLSSNTQPKVNNTRCEDNVSVTSEGNCSFYEETFSLKNEKVAEIVHQIEEDNKLHNFIDKKKDNEQKPLFDLSSTDIKNPFGKLWDEITEEIKSRSIFRRFQTYSVKCFITKSNDDLRQELLVIQIIKLMSDIFTEADIPLRLRPYEILITSPQSGLIEFLPNTLSIDALKKNLPPNWDLNHFFRCFFKNSFEEAQKNFAESLAAYSLVCYILNIKDRHNGNILLDMNGNVIHIDFGFILGMSPGNVSFETAPFKLTQVNLFILGVC